MSKYVKIVDSYGNPTEIQDCSEIEVVNIPLNEEWSIRTIDENGAYWVTTFLGCQMISSIQG
tara:strand:+ start:221 stop:406 length:186 start_codon:yes stop_codon:yes gene_type:complete